MLLYLILFKQQHRVVCQRWRGWFRWGILWPQCIRHRLQVHLRRCWFGRWCSSRSILGSSLLRVRRLGLWGFQGRRLILRCRRFSSSFGWCIQRGLLLRRHSSLIGKSESTGCRGLMPSIEPGKRLLQFWIRCSNLIRGLVAVRSRKGTLGAQQQVTRKGCLRTIHHLEIRVL